MQLDDMLERCEHLEKRAAALYRSYAAASRAEPERCALWTALAREEEDHARSIARVRAAIEPTIGWRTWLEGWEEALVDVADCLTAAERLGAEAPGDRQLSAALELEMTELEAMRRVITAPYGQPQAEALDDHAVRLAEAAMQLSEDPQVRLQAALIRARTRTKASP